MKFILPKNICSIISTINEHGCLAHVVGGCVRDMLIGKVPDDWDITTNALPQQIKAMFQRTYDTGIKHGTVTVHYGESVVEVTTWRSETQYTDHRRPDSVYFAKSLAEDLSRRDFTINALAYHPVEGLIDPFNGLNDIHLRMIRCVGDPVKRFSEDALRMLRAIRFSALPGFQLEEKTLAAIRKQWRDLAYVSMELIQAEVNKILESECPEKLALLWETGLDKIIFPGIGALSGKWTSFAEKHMLLADKKIFYLSLLFYTGFPNHAEDCGKVLLKRLRYDNLTIREVTAQLRSFGRFGTFSPRNIRKMVSEFGEATAKNTLLVMSELSGSRNHAENIKLAATKPALSGNHLRNEGLCSGKDIGVMLSLLALCVYEKPELNDTAILTKLAKNISALPVWKNQGES